MKRGRTRLLLIAAGALVFSAVVWGLLALQQIFIEERDEALADNEARRRAVVQFAHRELEQRLQRRLDAMRPTILRAKDEPLLAASEVVLLEQGRQVLPRQIAPDPRRPKYADSLRRRLADGPVPEETPPGVDPGPPWTTRVATLVELFGALEAGDKPAAIQAVRRNLEHRSNWRVALPLDAAATLALLDLLDRRSNPEPSLVAGLLRDGIAGRTKRIPGLQRSLLEGADRFAPDDFQALSVEMSRLAERYQVPTADFDARVAEALARVATPAIRFELPPDLATPALVVREGRVWVFERGRDDLTLGVEVQIAPMQREVENAMRERALIGPSDRVVVAQISREQPLATLGLAVESPQWAKAAAAAQDRYRIKAWLEGSVALLVFSVLGLAWAIYRRRHRFLDLKSQFVSAVSHELRTPLASIRLMAETLERRTKDLPKAKDYPTRIIRDIDALSFLVENILSFERISAGRWVAQPEPTSMRRMVDKLEEERDLWAKRDAELQCDGALDDVTLAVDPDLLSLLLTNLARNGCTYNEREPPIISIAWSSRGAGLTVTVSDNGVGIPPEEHAKIFDDFYRAPSSTPVRGSGLGLSIARKIMEAHQGSIAIDATGPEGTTFALRFPAGSVV